MTVRGKTVQIRRYIFDNLAEHPTDIASLVVARFGISRQAANVHLRELVESGAIESHGHTRSRSYKLKALAELSRSFAIAGLEEHVPWEEFIRPALEGLSKNIIDICAYGFTEMLNNAIDHSASEQVDIRLLRTHDSIDMMVLDHGIGVFRKIKETLALPDELEAIKQLVKGKLTTDPTRHTGEGIFFTSRIFDCYSVLSGNLYYAHVRQDDDWLIEDQTQGFPGTYVRMTISASSKLELRSVFDSFASSDDEYSFSRTTVPVALIQYGSENLISRSQAKRLIGRFEMFREVILDFKEIEFVGQGFADEIFRVFANNNPNVRLVTINLSKDVSMMIARAKGHAPVSGQKELF